MLSSYTLSVVFMLVASVWHALWWVSLGHVLGAREVCRSCGFEEALGVARVVASVWLSLLPHCCTRIKSSTAVPTMRYVLALVMCIACQRITNEL